MCSKNSVGSVRREEENRMAKEKVDGDCDAAMEIMLERKREKLKRVRQITQLEA